MNTSLSQKQGVHLPFERDSSLNEKVVCSGDVNRKNDCRLLQIQK